MKYKGDTAEIKFLLMSHERGYTVCKPFGENSKYDFIVDKNGELVRVQVKSTGYVDKNRRKERYVCNVSSGSKNTRMSYQKKDIDYIALLIIPLDDWYIIPVDVIHTKGIILYPNGDCKYTYNKYRIKGDNVCGW